MKRLMGIDYGDKRVGIAVTDPLRLTAQGLMVLENDRKLLSEIAKLCLEKDVEKVIVGLPQSLKGGASAQTAKVDNFIVELKARLPLPVLAWDERYSTKIVERTLIAADVSRARRKQVIDKMAAAYILQDYLEHERKI